MTTLAPIMPDAATFNRMKAEVFRMIDVFDNLADVRKQLAYLHECEKGLECRTLLETTLCELETWLAPWIEVEKQEQLEAQRRLVQSQLGRWEAEALADGPGGPGF